MAQISRVSAWAKDVGINDRGVARLLGVSKWTVIAWRTPHRVSEPVDWRERLIAGMEREIARLRAANAPDRQSNDRISR
jgi:hypothetical protein